VSLFLELAFRRVCATEPPPPRLAAIEAVEQATNLRVESGGRVGAEKKLPFEGLKGMTGARHGRTRRRGVREHADDSRAVTKRPKVKNKEVY
jgi:hypothetical protein